MPRNPRIVLPGIPHHVTHRGNNRQDIFNTHDDYIKYLTYLKSDLDANKSRLVAYCLMSNHVHLIIIPSNQKSLSKIIGSTHGHYTQYFNRENKTSGHLFEGRFHSCPLDKNHLIHAARYVERNPIRAGLVKIPWEYPWSSAKAHVRGESEIGILDGEIWDEFIMKTGLDWGDFINDPEQVSVIEKIREFTNSGKSFIDIPRGQAPDFYPPA